MGRVSVASAIAIIERLNLGEDQSGN